MLPVFLGFALLGGACLFELTGVWMMSVASGPIQIIAAVASHIAAAGFCAEGLNLRGATTPDSTRKSLLQVGWVIGLAFPIFGPIACLFIGLQSSKAKGKEKGASLEEQRSKAAKAAIERKRGEQQVDAGLEAIVDALKDRSDEVRIAAIDALRGDTSKKAVKLLALSRDNTVYDVRMRAVEGLARVSKHFGDLIAEAKKEQEAEPQSMKKLRRLASLCLEYAELGVEDAQVTRKYFEDAAMYATKGMELGDTDRKPFLIAARAKFRLQEYEEAEQLYREVADQDDTDEDALSGIAECRFMARDFESLPTISRWVLRQAGQRLPEDTSEACKFWIRTL